MRSVSHLRDKKDQQFHTDLSSRRQVAHNEAEPVAFNCELSSSLSKIHLLFSRLTNWVSSGVLWLEPYPGLNSTVLYIGELGLRRRPGSHGIYLGKMIDQCIKSFLQWQIRDVLEGLWGTVLYRIQKATNNLFRYIGEMDCLTTKVWVALKRSIRQNRHKKAFDFRYFISHVVELSLDIEEQLSALYQWYSNWIRG